MNDKFAADLRRHLVRAADERPAHGQYAAIVHAVGGVGQRHPLVARLTWFPGRIGPVPSAAVRYGLVAAALALATVAGALVGGASSPSTVFEGTWTSTDPSDGSAQILVVGPGNTPEVYFEDGYASGDACVNSTVKRFTARGSGTISGDHLDADFPDGGGCGVSTVKVAGSYAYRSESDTLLDQDRLTWNRALGGDPAPTQAPATDAPESAGPTPPLGNETFTSAVHGISIDHPSGWTVLPATRPWSGDTDLGDAADFLFDPAYDSRLALLIASQPYGDRTQDEWRVQTLVGICADAGHAFGSWHVDGVSSMLLTCGKASAALIPADERGYVILFLDRGEGPRTDGYDENWFRTLLETVDLHPEDAVDDPGPTVDG